MLLRPPLEVFPTLTLDAFEIDLLTLIQASESFEGTSESDRDVATRPNEKDQLWLNDEKSRKRGGCNVAKQEESKSQKKRKTTYDVRREQKVELTAQVEKLQKQLDELKFRVLVENGEVARSHARVAANNSVLQEFIQEQYVELANMQASLSCHLQLNSNMHTPAHTIIHLGVDRVQRHETLKSLKNRKIKEAKDFIMARSRGLDPRSTYSQEDHNSKPGEDYSVVHFESMPIHGASARDVFEAFIDVAQNAEIIITEMFGSITIRENNETDARDVSQMRLVTTTSQGTLVESNTAMFSEFDEKADAEEENYGVIVADFVDSDELYPYKPEERVRRDSTTVFMIRTLKQSVPQSEESASKEAKVNGRERIVVATRWTCSKIRRSKMGLSADALQKLQQSTVSFGSTMKKCIQQQLGKTNISAPREDTCS